MRRLYFIAALLAIASPARVVAQEATPEPIGNGTFWHNNRQFRFERDADGAIIGFQLDAGRVKNPRFTRVP